MPTATTRTRQIPDRHLVELVRSDCQDTAVTSLRELLQRDPLEAADLATEMLLGHGPDRVRACAAIVLGHSDSNVSRVVLRRALDSRNPEILGRVVHALGRVGGPEDLLRLRALQPPPTSQLGREVLMARTLIGYRHGLSETLVSAPRMVAQLTGRREPIEVGVRVRGTKARLVDGAAFEVPTLSFSPSSVHAFRCCGRAGGFALDASLRDLRGRRGFARPRLLGALLREHEGLERFGLAAWLLMDDRDGTGGAHPWLWVVRPDGAVTHAGRVRVGDRNQSFVIDRFQPPYGRPVRITGMLVGGALLVTEAVLGQHQPTLTRSATDVPRQLAG